MTAPLRNRLATALRLAAAETPMAIYALPGDDALWLPIADALLADAVALLYFALAELVGPARVEPVTL